MAPTPITPLTAPIGGDLDRGPHLIAVVLAQCAIATLVVAMRLYSRFLIKGLGWDDWLMLLTLILFIITASILTEMASIGGCRHLYYLSDATKYAAVRLNWIVQPFAIVSFATSKASVGLVLMRIIGPKGPDPRIWFLWIIITLSFVINITGAVMVFAQCSPVAALWTPGMEQYCWDPNVQMHYEVFVGSWNAFCDFSLAILPVTLVIPLNMSMTKRFGVCILLGLGMLACVSACVKTSMLSALGERSDLTWETFDLWAWTASETFLLIICGSIPPLRPLFDRMLGRDMDEYGNPRRSYRDRERSPRQSTGKIGNNATPKRSRDQSESKSGFARMGQQHDGKETHNQAIEMEEGWNAKSVYEEGSEFGDRIIYSKEVPHAL